ncbi:MAG: tRNA (adenosine(37)-N6)-threonylcarbamoyltransferase complex dimerization subunit type 1 TsaB [Bacteroidetes bacterium]|nr:tRNA (adenosine(37)-N6)-threonylcarbamoyltransferase complex dimerization subunit type 1 TsaB [Bacteroidota bacterium]
MILGIDTATARLGVALYDGESVIAAATFVRPNAHDELLAPLCRDLLAHAGIAMDDLDAVAVSAGPGSFTGLRIGMAAAKGFALALHIPIVAVPTHDAAAESVVRRWPLGAPVTTAAPMTPGVPVTSAAPMTTGVPVTPGVQIPFAVCIDARRDEVYIARYLLSPGEDGGWRAVEDVRVAGLDTVSAILAPGTLLAGDGAAKVSADGFTVLPDPASVFDAGAVARLGARLLARRGPDNAETCEPLYVQEFLVKQAKNPFLP